MINHHNILSLNRSSFRDKRLLYRLNDLPKLRDFVGQKGEKKRWHKSHSTQAITGPQKDSDLLYFLHVIIKSDVAQYYLFHTSANRVIERGKVHSHESLSLPFFSPKDTADPAKARKIVDKAAKVIKDFEKRIKAGRWTGKEDERKKEAKRIRGELEPLVREYYDIDKYEAMLIEDTLQLAIESTKKIPTLQSVSKEACQTYTKTLCEMLNNFGQGGSFKANGEVIIGQPYPVVRVSLTERIRRDVLVKTSQEELAKIFNRMKTLLQQEQGRFVFCQNLKVFDDEDLYISKPMQMRFWSHTAALNDADEVAGDIIQQKRKFEIERR